MKQMQTLLLLCGLVALLPAEPKQTSRSKPFAFAHVTVIDATGAPAQSDMTVVITGDRITDLGKTKNVKVPRGAQVVEARGKFLIPGLWDMHAHLEMWSPLPLYVANGVTGVRDMGGDLDLIRQWQKQIALGTIAGPRIVAAGPILDGPTPGYPMRITVKNADGGAASGHAQPGAVPRPGERPGHGTDGQDRRSGSTGS